MSRGVTGTDVRCDRTYTLLNRLKYLYLLFRDEELIPLDKWVFNTEAHPLPVFEWAEWVKERYNITTSVPVTST